MFNIRDFFSRIQNSHAKEVFIRSIIRDSVKKVANIDVSLESIAIRAGTVTFTGMNQADRSTIFIKKQAILKDIALNQEMRKIDDVR